jgi:two-component system heavy metal sensor histidine kinase CusS
MNSPPSRRPLRLWSMTTRLVCLQVLVVALLTSGVLAFVLFAVSQRLDADNREDLDSHAALLREWLEDPTLNTATLLQQIGAPLGGHVITPWYFARLLDEHGAPLVETKTDAAPPAAAFPAPGHPAAYWRVHNGPQFLMTSIRLDRLGTNQRAIQMQVALDVTDDVTLVRKTLHSTTIVFACTLLVSAALAWLITHRALRPVKALTEAAAAVQASQLGTRIDETGWPVELTPLAREFDAMLGRLDGSFSRLARFSSDLSHELRTPINNLRGEAEVILSRPRTAEEYRAVLESSLEEYSRVTHLIDTLLFIAKADQPESGLHRQSLDATRECLAVVDFFEAASAEREITLVVHGQAVLYCDPMLFRRALSNLVDNSLRHTPRGGRINLIVSGATEGGTKVEVSDSGSGIAPEHLQRVFERYYQVPKAETDPAGAKPGFGLGLAIVKSVMELHRGRVEITSTPGQGTTVCLYFPSDATASRV